MLYKISNYALLKKLLEAVPVDDSCMVWPRSKIHYGYGGIRIGDRNTAVHRVAYELTIGPIPDGMDILHHCDNPPCFRPSHLFPGTHLDNMHDMYAKERRAAARGERVNTAKLTEDQIREIRRLRDQGRTFQSIADEFGVVSSNIASIVYRRYWKHVD